MNEYRTCECGRKYRVKPWKTEEERAKCFTCFVKEHFLTDVFKGFSDRQRKILDYRFGITEKISHTLEETGKLFGVTRERIRQIEAKSLMKLDLWNQEKAAESAGKAEK